MKGSPRERARGRPLRVSIRIKVLVALAAALAISMGTYAYLAVSVFARDKVAYVFDVNASMVSGLAEHVRANLDSFANGIRAFSREALEPGKTAKERDAAAARLFEREADVLCIEVYHRVAGREGLSLAETFVNRDALDATVVSEDDLALLRREHPLPFSSLDRTGEEILVQNTSLPPAAAIFAVACRAPSDDRIVVVRAKLDRLLRLFRQSSAFETYLVDQGGEIVAHPSSAWVVGRKNVSANPIVREAWRTDLLQSAREFVAPDGTEKIGAYARLPIGRLAVVSEIPKQEALRAMRELIRRTVLFAVAVLAVAFLASVLLSRVLTSPLRRLSVAAAAVGRGQFDVKLDVHSRDEIGDLADAFAAMTQALQAAQAQVIQSEKMAAFGQLGAGIAHEVKNPMTGIIGFAQIGQRKADDKAKAVELFKLIEKDGLRCHEILINFLKFARPSTGETARVDVNAMVENTATMLRHQLMIHKVQLETRFDSQVPAIMGSAPELQQVLLNLGINAQQAMPNGGKVLLRTERDSQGYAVVEVVDNGPGIPLEIQQKIFEPFFSTKPQGEGTGLGLSVSYGIIKAHRGTLTVRSQPGQGATFVMRIPPADPQLATGAS